MTELQKLNQEGKAVHSLGTKTYITECFFQPKAVPIRYAETVIVKIGSQKKTYYESVYYEMKPIPTHWRETMIANLNFQNCKTEAKISREEIHHYISLPQETNSERFI